MRLRVLLCTHLERHAVFVEELDHVRLQESLCKVGLGLGHADLQGEGGGGKSGRGREPE